MAETEATVIPQIRQVFRMAKAELDALAGLRDGALAYATDNDLLYRQNGDGAANWEAITTKSIPGLYKQGDVADFQTNPATGPGGDTTTPANLNDNNTGNVTGWNVLNTWVEIDFGVILTLRRWRQFGEINNVGDGEFKIAWHDIPTDTWIDWVTGIPTRPTADWTALATEPIIHTDKVRIIMTAIDSLTLNRAKEWEVIY